MSAVSTVAPHQMRRPGGRVAIGSDVVGDPLLLDEAGERLGEGRLAVSGQSRHGRIDHLQADAGVRAGRRNASEVVDPGRALDPSGERLRVGVGPGEKRFRAAERLRPLQRVEIVLDAQHGGRVDGVALEKTFGQLAALGEPENFWQRPCRRIGFQPLGRPGAQDDHAVRALAAENFLPGEGHDVEFRPVELLREHGGRRVADRQALAVGGDPAGVGHADAGRRAVPGEDDVLVEIDTCQVGKLAIGRLQCPRVLDFQLLDDVGDPALAKTFPGEHVHAARAEHRPQRHLDRAGVRAGRNADAIVRRDPEHLAGQVDRKLELGFADLRPMRPAESGVFENCGGPARALGARSGRKAGVRRPRGGHHIRHLVPSFQMGASRWGEVSRRG